ncbi:DUF4148 domain-containing protein [Paraburkholderia sediminicola]|uniref:DUF4148 domain-containing protein n=1 Tax=Paraburkholderia sediminicola TaxID=458836 RepID=UPI0038BE16BB
MRNAMWLAGFALSCACVSAAVAVDTIPLREPTPGPYEFYQSHEPVLRKPRVQGLRGPAAPEPQPASQVGLAPQVAQVPQVPQVSRGKTRDEVKRELAAARAWGCMNVPDSQYPQPCPAPGSTRAMADAFQIE